MIDLPRAREEIPGLIEELRERNPRGAEYIEDVFSEVLKGLRRDDVRDPEMVDWLYEAIALHGQQITNLPQRLVR